MKTENQYESLERIPHIIDKTEFIERGITAFPSVFVEGAADSGKTTAVNLLLAKHPEVKTVSFFMEEEKNADVFAQKLCDLKVQVQKHIIWVIFENFQSASAECIERIADFIEKHAKKTCKVILVSRERPEPSILKLVWKRKTELVSMEKLYFTRNEVRDFIEKSGSILNPDEIYAVTGGWAGCVNLMARLCERKAGVSNEGTDLNGGKQFEARNESADLSSGKQGKYMDASGLRRCYEIDAYIKYEIIGALSAEEQEIMRRAAVCPWIDQELCSDVWGVSWLGESLENLGRKGMLVNVAQTGRWKMAPLFQSSFPSAQSEQLWKRLGSWYELNGHISEALHCLQQSGDEKAYKDCIIKHFDRVPFLEHDWSVAAQWRENSPEVCYLRGMLCFFEQDLDGLQREIRKVERQDNDGARKSEILLNLNFVNPQMSLTKWLELLKTFSAENRKFRLYNILGGSFSYLCGLRDLSDMFACMKKEENARAHLWKECLGEEEWQAYCQAKLVFYLETGRWDALKEEEKTLPEQWCLSDSWQMRLGCLYILFKLNDENKERMRLLEESLFRENSDLCTRNTEAVRTLVFNGNQERENLARRLKYVKLDLIPEINEKNYIMFCSFARGYMLLSQYEKAGRIMRRVIPYLHRFRRYRLLAELLFLQAIVSWEKDMHGEALRAVIESFVISRTYRYMQFYVFYGKKGNEVLEAYVQWQKSNAPEGWHRKKKYNYGNILRMPFEDYIETILRKAGKGSQYDNSEKNKEERLTMTETIILQDIGMGLSNNEICASLNLKLSTVKNHIYSLYRKLGVNSRVQAVLKGKELGMLD